MTETNFVTEDEDGSSFEFSYYEYIYIVILIYLWYLGGETIHISVMNKFKLVMLKL